MYNSFILIHNIQRWFEIRVSVLKYKLFLTGTIRYSLYFTVEFMTVHRCFYQNPISYSFSFLHWDLHCFTLFYIEIYIVLHWDLHWDLHCFTLRFTLRFTLFYIEIYIVLHWDLHCFSPISFRCYWKWYWNFTGCYNHLPIFWNLRQRTEWDGWHEHSIVLRTTSNC